MWTNIITSKYLIFTYVYDILYNCSFNILIYTDINITFRYHC